MSSNAREAAVAGAGPSLSAEDPLTAHGSIRRPLMVVVSAPSGGGKSTLCQRLLAACPAMRYSISCTTRPPRGDERDGVAYHFLSAEQFERRITANEFIEYAIVHGHGYGTLRADVESALAAGRDVLLDIDVQGTRLIRDAVAALPSGHRLRRAFVDVFIMPPSLAVLEQRLRGRAEDPDAIIARRMQNARAELEAAPEYRYRIVNDDLACSAAALHAIVIAEHHRNLDQTDYAAATNSRKGGHEDG